jgi:ubiquinone biosynthesis monooxygenase Coq7
MSNLPPPSASSGQDVRNPPAWLLGELRSDHAGETGAVYIYRGMLAVSQNEDIRRFATAHLATEERHLALMDDLVKHRERSRLLPMWRVAGWLTGALPALFGRRASFATIAAVEQFVDQHYQAQIDRLDCEGLDPELRAVLETCRLDEVDHRDEALSKLDQAPGFALRAWCWLVGWGSAQAVGLAKLI